MRRILPSFDDTRWLLPILLVLVVVRLAVAYHLRASFFSSGDQSYNDIAEQILNGHGFSMNGRPYVDNPPVYPLLVTAAFWVLGHHWWAIASLQTLLDCASVVLLFALGRRLFGYVPGVLAAAAFAVYPYLASQSAELMDTTPFVCGLLVFLYLTVRATQTRSLWAAAGAGAAAGVAFLIRPTVAAIVVVFPLLVALLGAGRREVVRMTAAVTAAGLVVVAPWMIRNAVDYHAFVPGAAKAGINFWKGNSPYAAQYISEGKSVDLLPERPGTPQPPLRLDPVQADNWWRDRALHWIRTHPGAWAHGLAVKLVAFWTWDLNPRSSGDTGTKNALYAATYAPLLLLALLGVSAGWAVRRRSVGFVFLVLLLFTAVHVLTVAYTRLRAPVDPLLMLLAAAFVVDLGALAVRSRRRREAA